MDKFEFIQFYYHIFWGYNGYEILFYVFWGIALIVEKDTWKRKSLVWYPIIILTGLINPLTVMVGDKIWGEWKHAYYCRQFSLIGTFFVMAYGMVLLIQHVSKVKKFIFTCALLCVVMLSGTSIYTQDWMAKATNYENVPDDVKYICDELNKIEGDKIITVPEYIAKYFRQYDSGLHMIFSRSAIDGLDIGELSKSVSSMEPDIPYIMKTLCEQGGDYVVLRNTESILQSLEENQYEPCIIGKEYLACEVSGYDKVKVEYDEKEQVASITYLDANGQMRESEEGYSVVKKEYDEKGNLVVESYYNEKDEKVRCKKGFAEIQYGEYVNNNCPSVLKYVDEQGKITALADGIAIIKKEYNNFNVIEELYYGEDGLPFYTLVGNAGLKFEYNKDGRIISNIYIDEYGAPIQNTVGYSKWIREFDDLGRISTYTYFDIEDNRVMIVDGYSKAKNIYDDSGNRVQVNFLDVYDNLTKGVGGYAGIQYEYDEDERITGWIYIDEQGNPVENADGYAYVKRAYAESGEIAEDAYYDLNMERVK